MRRFSDILNDLRLRDLPLQGGPYTWRGGLNGSSKSRLDRFVVSADWESHCCKVMQSCLLWPVYDHCPILLDSNGVRTGPSPFRFELMWMKYAGFKETLKGWWQNMQFHGSYSFILSAKLKALKGVLRNCVGCLIRMILRRKEILNLRKLRVVLMRELISRGGYSRRRSPGDKNPERPG